MAFGIERIEEAVKHLTTQITGIGNALRESLTETRSRVDALTHNHADLGSRVDEARRASEANSRDIAAARRELAELHALIESRRADAAEALAAPAADPEPQSDNEDETESYLTAPMGPSGHVHPLDNGPNAFDHDPHDDLLAQAAGVANAELVCHRDTWAFLTQQACRGEHFSMPVDISPAEDANGADRGSGTVRVGLSGRSLLGLADALWHVTQSPSASPGTRHLAAQTYNRIQAALAHTHSGPPGWGTAVRIVIDDRVPYDEADETEKEDPDDGAPCVIGGIAS